LPLAVDPVDAQVTQEFGMGAFARTHPNWYIDGIHRGRDYGAYFQPVYAPVDGLVLHAGPGNSAAWGNYIQIQERPVRRIHSILHLDGAGVQVGDIVNQGQEIGESGNTGLGTAPHTHWQVEDTIDWRGPTVTGSTIDPRVLLLPSRYTRKALESYAIVAARRNLVPSIMFERQINQESGFRPFAASWAQAYGIAQIVPRWHPTINPWDAHEALDYAAALMAIYYDEFKSWRLALAAYNAGGTAVRQYGGIPPFKETQDYVRTIYGAHAEEPEGNVDFGNLPESQAIDRWKFLQFQDMAQTAIGALNRLEGGVHPTATEVRDLNLGFAKLRDDWPKLWEEEKGNKT
jgi:hypothetical protein